MADNVTIPTTGSGTATPVIATDDVSSVHYQKVKLDAGGDGASTPVLGGNGSSEVRVWAMGLVRRGKYPYIGEMVEEFADKAKNSRRILADGLRGARKHPADRLVAR